jgi:hypothetical protein
MSIDHLKKQSKNLKRLWPEFAQAHGSTPTLAACQELVARSCGYASWHSAVSQAETKARASTTVAAGKPLRHESGGLTVELWDGFPGQTTESVRFGHLEPALLEHVTEQLDEYLDKNSGLFDEDVKRLPRSERLKGMRELDELCSALVEDDPDFVDGYAHLVACKVALGAPELGVGAGQATFERAEKLIEAHGAVHVPYSSLKNRPFHRLAHGLVLADLAVAKAAPAAEADAAQAAALAIIEKMLAWWPNDNMGFRLLKQRCRPATKKAA